MAGMIKEEFNNTVRKKRFIVLTALLFIAAIAAEIATKRTLMNDLTYILKIQKYLAYLFNPLMGMVLILSMHRKKFTKSSIMQAEEKGVKRCTLVLGRTIAGALILLVFYALMFVLMVLLGLVLGAHLSVPQMGELLLKTGTGCAAAVTTFVVCMFFEYLFAFPVISMALYCGLMLGIPCFFELYFGYYADEFYKYATWVSAQCSMNLFYTTALLSYPRWNSFLICLIHIAVFLPLTMLVFRLKKKDKKKRKKKGEEAVDPEIKEILEQAELTEDIVE
ncbi:MAG: hypothetical protein J5777_05780 [Clostridiales bacterium]|nr:hypothetical protein [Clostridiales bacterium]